MLILVILSVFSPLVPVLTGIKKRTTALLWFYPLTGLFFDLLISFLKRGLHVNNLWPANIFILAEFLLLSFIYRKKIFINNLLFFTFITGFSLFFIGQTISKSIWTFNMVGGSFFAFTYILYSILGFYAILKEQKIIYLERSWFFWLNVAIIIYASGAFLLFLFKSDLVRINEKFYLKLWNNIFLILNTVKNLLLAVALYYYPKRKDHEPV